MDDRLDWCLTWGENCGHPAALAFCQRKRFANVQAFASEKVGRSARTRYVWHRPGLRRRFLHGVPDRSPAPGRSTSSQVFANPENNGYRLDVCREWGANCGKPAADAFCAAKGFSGSLQHAPDPEPGYASTRVISSGQICKGSFCTGFQQIICQ